MTLWLHGVGQFHPDNEISNRFLEELDIGTSNEWILERVGIHARRTVLPLDYIRTTRNRDPRAALEAADWSQAELGAAAARMAIDREPEPLAFGDRQIEPEARAEEHHRAVGIEIPGETLAELDAGARALGITPLTPSP